MKKISLIAGLASLFIFTEVNAQSLICPFTDYFYVSTGTPAIISSLNADGNVLVQKEDSLNFTTSCKSNTSTSSGNVYLTVKLDDCNLCTLHILDGPYEMNPTIVFVNCVGNLVFSGMDHAWGTYTYKLKFSDKDIKI